MRISSERYGPLIFQPLNISHCPGIVLPGSTILFSQNDFGTITIQQLVTERYSINYFVFNIVSSVTLFFEYKLPFLIRSWQVLKGSVLMKTLEKEKGELKQGQFALFNEKNIPRSIAFETGKEYYMFDSTYDLIILEPLFNAFPSLKNFCSLSNNPGKSYQGLSNLFASPEMIRITDNLLKAPYEIKWRKIYFENRINDYVFEVIIQSKQEINPGVPRIVRDKVYAAHNIILYDLSKHYTIKEISVMVGLSESRLKKFFKLVFGITIYDCLFRARMEKAYDLLMNTTKPVKEISAIVGFDYLANFVKAFGNYFGYTPGQVRKQ